MSLFNDILARRGVDAAAAYAAAAQFGAGIRRARELRSKPAPRPGHDVMRRGKTEHDRLSGALARHLANVRDRREANQRRANGGAEKKAAGKK